MPDIEIATAFEEIFSKMIVRISARFLSNNGKIRSGTGCIIGYVKNTDYEHKALILTAGHVLKSPKNEPVEWTIERFDLNGQEQRKVIFKTPNKNPKGPKVFYYQADDRLDLGAMFADTTCIDGRTLMDLGKSSEPKETLVPIIDKHKGIGPGTRVAWAGFPKVVKEYLGFPQLCYYEGVVAATIDRNNRPPLYLLDGHNDFGVSGGPVWAWDDETSRVELVGIIVSYLQQELPGFVCATPIHPLLHYLDSNYPSQNR